MLLLKCPKCKQNMKYQSLKKDISKARKRCVYCGASFMVKGRVVKPLKP